MPYVLIVFYFLVGMATHTPRAPSPPS
jgi:hypothetical protein